MVPIVDDLITVASELFPDVVVDVVPDVVADVVPDVVVDAFPDVGPNNPCIIYLMIYNQKNILNYQLLFKNHLNRGTYNAIALLYAKTVVATVSNMVVMNFPMSRSNTCLVRNDASSASKST